MLLARRIMILAVSLPRRRYGLVRLARSVLLQSLLFFPLGRDILSTFDIKTKVFSLFVVRDRDFDRPDTSNCLGAVFEKIVQAKDRAGESDSTK